MKNKLKVKIQSYNQDVIKTMWIAGRNCYFKGGFEELEKQYNRKGAINFLKNIYSKGHLSIFEFGFFSFNIENISRSCLAQLTRHRIGFSYAVQSQHYQNHSDFKYKDLEQYLSEEHKQEYYGLMERLNTFYKQNLKSGLPRYIAREVLPNSCLVHLSMGANLRALDNFWKLRKTSNNTPEIIQLSNELYKGVNKVIPELKEIIPY